MIFKHWLKPGMRIKRWLLLGMVGSFITIFGLIEIINRRFTEYYNILLYLLMIFSGFFIIYISISQGKRSIVEIIKKDNINVSFNTKKFLNEINKKSFLAKGPKIVVIGGGTGLSTMLRGLKKFTSNITAVVTVGDDGGGSGVLREDLGMLPPGDIRNCILALADTEPVMEELLRYRFKEGRLKNQSFGNLFLAAMDGISDNFMIAVKQMSHVLAVTGKVLPVTLDNMRLKAKLKNGQIVEGESKIPEGVIENNSNIERVFIDPVDAAPLQEAVDAILEADAVILGPGSLYTSIIPNLLVEGISDALSKTDALKLYVCNIMTQRGETDKYSVKDHVEALLKHANKKVIDYVVANTGKISKSFEEKYLQEEARLVSIDEEEVEKLKVKVMGRDFIKIKNDYIRHDHNKLAVVLMEIILEKKMLYNKEKISEYFYVVDKIKTKHK